MSHLRALNIRTNQVLAGQVQVAASFYHRTKGLLGRAGMKKGEGLYITQCSSIHTFFMRFSIDILFLDKERKITKMVSKLKPFRVAFGARRTIGVLELPEGTVDKNQCEIGDLISLE